MKNEIIVYIAFLIFGLGSWILANSIFVEVAALYTRTPEKKNISSYMLLSLQFANIFPFTYMIFNRRERHIKLENVIYFLLIMGTIVSVFISIFWDHTSILFGSLHSTALLLLVFLGGIVSSMTSLVFYPFASKFPSEFTTALATGEGLSGVVAGCLGIIQDSGGEKLRFSIDLFFCITSSFFILALFGFLFLVKHPIAKSFTDQKSPVHPRHYAYSSPKNEKVPLLHSLQGIEIVYNIQKTPVIPKPKTHHIESIWMYIRKPLALQMWITCLSFGVLPSIMPYIGSSYRHGSEVLKWSSVFSMAFDPIGRLTTQFWRCSWTQLKYIMFILSTIVFIFIMEALDSNGRYLNRLEYGGIFVVVFNSIFVYLSSFSQTMVYFILKEAVHEYGYVIRRHGLSSETEHQLTENVYELAGFSLQAGAFIGTIVTFITINIIS